MEFIPTFLYIKQHTITGKCYFGKTTRKDPIKYLGSGKRWRSHIKKHGTEHVKTLWYKLFTDRDNCTEFACFISDELEIVKSDKWLNIISENGLDGLAAGHKFSTEICEKRSVSMKGKSRGKGRKCGPPSAATKAKLSASKLGKPKSPEHRKNLSIALKGNTRRKGTSTHIWITNEEINAMIKKTDEIPTGWRKGRIQCTAFNLSNTSEKISKRQQGKKHRKKHSNYGKPHAKERSPQSEKT